MKTMAYIGDSHKIHVASAERNNRHHTAVLAFMFTLTHRASSVSSARHGKKGREMTEFAGYESAAAMSQVDAMYH